MRHWRLIEINQPGAQPLTTAALRADERIVNYLKGLNYLDDRLAPLAPAARAAGPGDRRSAAVAAGRRATRSSAGWRQAAPGRRLPVLQLLGPDAASKQLVAWHAAAALGLRLYRLPAELLPTQVADLETLARLGQRETLLLPFALYLDAHEVEKSAPAEGQAPPVSRFLARTSGVLFVDTQDVRPGLGGSTVALDVDEADPGRAAAGLDRGPRRARRRTPPARLAGQFNLNLATLRQIARAALAEPSRAKASCADRLWKALPRGHPAPARSAGPAHRSAGHLGRPRAARRPSSDLLRQIAAQVGQRARVYDDWGFAREAHARPRHQRPVRRRERHRQDHGRRGARQRAAARTSTASTSRPW